MGNHFLVLQKIKNSDAVGLQAVKLLATYMQVHKSLLITVFS